MHAPKIGAYGLAVFALSLSVLLIPMPMLAKEWRILRVLAVTLFPAVLSALNFCIGALWGRNSRYYDDTDVVVALRQLRGVRIYAVFVFAFAVQGLLIPKVGYPLDAEDQEFFWFVCIWFPAVCLTPIVCAVLGWRIKSFAYISNERGLVFGFLVFFLFAGVFVLAYWGVAPNFVYVVLLNCVYWLLPAAVTGIAFTAALLFRKNKTAEL